MSTEVTSTTNVQGSKVSASEINSTTKINTNDTNGMSGNNNNNTTNKTNNNILTAEKLAEHTLEGLLAEHPGELTRTGSPHIVSGSISSIQSDYCALQ